MGTYSYNVLRKVDSIEDIPEGATIYVDVGEHEAKTPDAAALSAAETIEKTGSYRPVSSRHFNQTEIVPTTGFAVGARSASAPPPAPAAIDPDGPCAWAKDGETCGHNPVDHGDNGDGICRVDGCPCGKYTPPPAAETLT